MHGSVAEPHISGRIAFPTGPRAISYAEPIMELVEHYHLGEIVGAAAAGTNGDIAQMTGPNGCTTYFARRRVLEHDGSRHHLIGVRPTIPASRTLAAGPLAGMRSLKGLAYVRGATR